MRRGFVLLLCQFVFTARLCAWHSVAGLDTHEKITNDAILLVVDSTACPTDTTSINYPGFVVNIRAVIACFTGSRSLFPSLEILKPPSPPSVLSIITKSGAFS